MSSQCRFCGSKIFSDAVSCEHCGKQLRKTADKQPEQRRVSNIESWKGRTIPPWLMYLVTAFFLACLVIMFLDGAPDPKPAQPSEASTQAEQSEVDQALEKETGKETNGPIR